MKIAKYFLLSVVALSVNFIHVFSYNGVMCDNLAKQKISLIKESVDEKTIKESDLDFDLKHLIDQAKNAREKSYSPYSKFKVGAAVLSKSGKIYTGTNIENASYGLTICAERTAIFKAVCEGEKGNFIKAIAIVLDAPEFGAPCGACRQIINEFGEPDVYVIMATVSGKYKIEQLKTLLPYAFKFEQDKK